MPYKSERQRAYMHAQLPELAALWDSETGGKIVKAKKTTTPKKKPAKKRSR